MYPPHITMYVACGTEIVCLRRLRRWQEAAEAAAAAAAWGGARPAGLPTACMTVMTVRSSLCTIAWLLRRPIMPEAPGGMLSFFRFLLFASWRMFVLFVGLSRRA